MIICLVIVFGVTQRFTEKAQSYTEKKIYFVFLRMPLRFLCVALCNGYYSNVLFLHQNHHAAIVLLYLNRNAVDGGEFSFCEGLCYTSLLNDAAFVH